MNPFSSEVIERLGWVLIHSLWQFAVVAIVAAVTVAILRQRAARIRYCVLVVSMTLMIFAPCLTWILIPASGWASALRVNAVETNSSLSIAPGNTSITQTEPMQSDSEVVVGSTVFEESPVLEFNEAELTRRADAQPLSELITDILHPWFSWNVGGWLIGVLLCSLRPLLGWRTLRRLRRIGINSPSDEVVAVFTRVSERLGLHRAVRLLHSTLTTGPMVIGYFKPIVLLPLSLVTSIPMSQLEAILAHELAHIRRHDFVINLAQTLLETLFFYHPAIWLLSRRIRIEREHCCDDLVIKLFDNGVEYGRALLAIEQLQSQRTVLALGATDGSLLGRIRRITGTTSHQPRNFPFLATVIALSVICGMWIAGQELNNVVAETQVNFDSIAAPKPESPPKPIQADLPTGVRVKLVGVTTPTVISEEDLRRLRTIAGVVAARIVPLPTAEKPDTRQWWRGDGTTLDKPPAAGEAWTVQKSWEDGRQFAFEFSGLADRDTKLDVVMFHLQPGKPRQPVVVIQTTLESDPGKRIVMASIAPNTGADSATLELRVGTAESAIVKLDTEGRSIDSLATAAHHSDSMKQIIENIELLRITQNGDKAEVWTRPINTNDALASVMFSVLDNSGKLHSSQTGYLMNNEQLTLFSNVRADTIREIHFEIRSLNHSVTFENISRKPGTKTNVSVTVAPLPMPPETIQASLPNGGTIELLGVSTPPIELLPSKDKREWWKGDGTAMDAAPIPMGSINVGASQIDGREFVFRASNLVGQIPMDVTLKERFKDGQPYKPEGNGWSRGSTHSGSINENQKDKWQVTAEHVAGPVGDADSVTLEVRVGSDVTAVLLLAESG